jgi:hypothetical protein
MRPTILGLTLAAVAAGCGGSDTPAPQPRAALQGTWTGCRTLVGGSDEKRTLTFAGSSVTVNTTTYVGSTGTCTGATQSFSSSGTTFSLGADVAATLVTASVTAQQLTLNYDPTAEYTIVYVDAGAPNAPALFLGDLSATPGLDGTAPSKRPTVLDASWTYQKQ